MSTDRWMDQLVMVHIFNAILLSHKKELIWVSSSEVKEPGACYTEWNKSEKQISCINVYIWNVEKWYWWTCLQGRKRGSDIENKLMNTARGGPGWIERVVLK